MAYGWNFVSLPVIPVGAVSDGDTPAKLFKNISYTALKTLDSSGNLISVSNTTPLVAGKAYYITVTSNSTYYSSTLFGDTTFVYDGDGGRIKRITPNDETIFIGSLYEVKSEELGVKSIKHIFLGDTRICSLTRTVGAASGGEQIYYHGDHLGSTSDITDATGVLKQHTEYLPYGETYIQEGEEKTEYLYTGKILDSSTGLYFYGRRYYDPSLGRWITPDPTVQKPYDPQDLNRYAYCRNNPIKYIDPTGLGWWKKLVGAFKEAVGSFIGGITGGTVGGFIGAVIGGPIGAVIGGYLGGSAGAGAGGAIQHGGNILTGMGMGVVNGLMAAPFVAAGFSLGGPAGAIAGAMLFSGGYSLANGGGFENALISSIVTGAYASAGYGLYQVAGKHIINQGLQLHYKGGIVGGSLGNALDNSKGEVWHATTKGRADSIMKNGASANKTYVFDPNEVVDGVKLGEMKTAQLQKALGIDHNIDTIVHIPRDTVALQPAPNGAFTSGYASQATIYGIEGTYVGPSNSWYTTPISGYHVRVGPMSVYNPKGELIYYED